MTFQETSNNGIPVIELKGKVMGGLNSAALHEHLKKLISERYHHIILDFSRVDWINSLGMGRILACLTTIRQSGGDFHFVGLGERIKHYFKITKLDTVLQIYKTQEDAVNQLLRAK